MPYRLRHRTAYEYETDVSVAHHLLRLTPPTNRRQHCREHELRFDPQPKCLQRYTDYYGNATLFLTMEGVHRGWQITAQSLVELEPFAPPQPRDTPPWESVPALLESGQAPDYGPAAEFRFSSPLIHCRAEYADYARVSFAPDRPILEAAIDLTRRIHADFQFDPKATHVATPIEQAFRERRGVCQDFAQIQIACLRSLGIPARYVSGYLETQPPPGQPKLAGADASHAWVSVYCPGPGWIDLDPTNNCLPADRHIVVAYGRDFSDVSPVRGVIVGGGHHTLHVAVDVTRCEGEA